MVLEPVAIVCMATTFAVALFPLFEEVQLLIDQSLDGAVVLCEQLVHFEVLPLYVKVALIDTDHKTVPTEFLYVAVLVLVIVLEDDIVDSAEDNGISNESDVMIVSI